MRKVEKREGVRDIFGAPTCQALVFAYIEKPKQSGKEWGTRARPPGLTIWHCPLIFVSWGSALPFGACFLSTKIEVVVEIK